MVMKRPEITEPKREQLVELLEETFEPEELGEFLMFEYPEVSHEKGRKASGKSARDAAQDLQKSGHISDHLFTSLARRRPRQKDKIEEVREEVLGRAEWRFAFVALIVLLLCGLGSGYRYQPVFGSPMLVFRSAWTAEEVKSIFYAWSLDRTVGWVAWTQSLYFAMTTSFSVFVYALVRRHTGFAASDRATSLLTAGWRSVFNQLARWLPGVGVCMVAIESIIVMVLIWGNGTTPFQTSFRDLADGGPNTVLVVAKAAVAHLKYVCLAGMALWLVAKWQVVKDWSSEVTTSLGFSWVNILWTAFLTASRGLLPLVLFVGLAFAISQGMFGLDDLFAVGEPVYDLITGCMIAVAIGAYARSVLLLDILREDGSELATGGIGRQRWVFTVLFSVPSVALVGAVLYRKAWVPYLLLGFGLGTLVTYMVFFFWQRSSTAIDGVAEQILSTAQKERANAMDRDRSGPSVWILQGRQRFLAFVHTALLFLFICVHVFVPTFPVAAMLLLALSTVRAVYMYMRFRYPASAIPALALLVAFGASSLFGLAADFRTLRSRPGDAPVELERITACKKLDGWEGNGELAQGADDPLIVVGTSGGGIRAAAWSLFVLHRIQALYPESIDNIQVITGASGGIVGAAQYVASLQRSGNEVRSGDSNPRSFVRQIRTEALNRVVPVLLFPWVYASMGVDRGNVLEDVLVAASGQSSGVSYLERGLRKLYKGKNADWRPLLVFTPMEQESGRPLLISNLVFDDAPGRDGRSALHTDFVSVYSQFYDRPLGDVRIATFARMSASFPVISPAGRIGHRASQDDVPKPGAPPVRHIVDAGYFDNYGVYAAAQYLRDLSNCKREGRSPRPVILLLISAFDDHGGLSRSDVPCPVSGGGATFGLFDRMFAVLRRPLGAATKARETKNQLYNELVLQQVGAPLGLDVEVIRLSFGGNVPLSWAMTESDEQQLYDWLPTEDTPYTLPGKRGVDLTCDEVQRAGEECDSRELEVDGGVYRCGRDEVRAGLCRLAAHFRPADPPAFCRLVEEQPQAPSRSTFEIRRAEPAGK